MRRTTSVRSTSWLRHSATPRISSFRCDMTSRAFWAPELPPWTSATSKLLATRTYASYAEKMRALRQAEPEQMQTGSIRDPTNADGKSSRKDPKMSKQRRKGYGDSTQVICQLKELSKFLPGNKPLFTDVSLGFYKGAKVGVLGPNGVGKSSLMKVIAGIDEEYDGTLTLKGDIKVGYLAQEPQLDPTKTVRENILDGIQDKMRELHALDQKREALAQLQPTDPKHASLAKEIKNKEADVKERGILDLRWKVEKAMSALRCPDPDREVTSLSGGETRRVALCKLLCSQPDFLLLDEPTNHLDAESVAWLESYLADYKGTVLAVTHDRYFLDNVAGWILELDRGQAYPHEGNYSSWLEAKQQRLELEKKKENLRMRQMKQELEWIRTSPKGRLTKNKARIKAYDKMAQENVVKAPEPGTIVIPPGPRLGGLVIDAKNVNKSFDGRCLIKNLNFSLQPGAIVGIIGPNGVGKTTLLNIIAGTETQDSGEIRIGPTVQLGFVGQRRAELREGYTVYEEISDGEEEIDMGHSKMSTRSYVAAFHFRGPAQEKSVEVLSGGERNRVYLAKMLKGGCNVIMLDEPTNDLDVDVLRNLENAIADFAGCVVVVTHDRWFLDRICTHIIAFEGDGSVTYFDGSYGEYMAQRPKASSNTGNEGARRFKKLGL